MLFNEDDEKIKSHANKINEIGFVSIFSICPIIIVDKVIKGISNLVRVNNTILFFLSVGLFLILSELLLRTLIFKFIKDIIKRKISKYFIRIYAMLMALFYFFDEFMKNIHGFNYIFIALMFLITISLLLLSED